MAATALEMATARVARRGTSLSMSLHRSLRTQPSGLNQHRNVLTRAERIAQLTEEERFDREAGCPIGIVKVANRQTVTKKKKAEEKTEEGEETTETTEATTES